MKCGIEIHQRLDSLKLFCRCPSRIHEEMGDSEIVRRLHPVASELGEVDVAAQFEYLKGREYHYQAYEESTCLVEADEEPPHHLNLDALGIALEVALMLGSRPVDELQIMRKTVVDGSNTSGFQRTSLLARGGFVETSKGKVGIQTICLEEESSGIVSGSGAGKVEYKLDRLGIPLVEIATAPDMVDSGHVRETAERIGAILRATGKVLRGLGTIRQDVNVSIEGGARMEIKGAQELGALPKIVEAEVMRQEKLIAIREELKRRKVKLGGAKIADVSYAFAKTQSKLVKRALDAKGAVLAVKLEKYSGILGTELYPSRRFGSEMSDYAKAAADVGGIIHSDEDFKKYQFSDAEIGEVRKKLSAAEGDAFVMVAAEKRRAEKALLAAFERAKDALGELREEVRKVLPDGVSTSYMRPMPGAARLYPETDLAPVRITEKMVSEARKRLPEMPEVKLAQLKKVLNPELAEKIMRSRNLPLFEKIAAEAKADPTLVATTLEETLVSLRREGIAVEKISDEKMEELFSEFAKGGFAKAAIPEILKLVAAKPKEEISDLVGEGGLAKLSGKELEQAVGKELAAVPDKKKAIGAVMAKLRLRADPEEVMKLIKKKA